MLRERARRKPRVAFVLSGGGNLGAMQIGMLKALTEHGIVPDVVLGCSVGALNGAAYAARPTPAGVAVIEEHWKSIATTSLMPASRIPNAVQLVRKGVSIHRNDGLVDGIETMLGPSRMFDQLVLPFQCVATDVELATEHWFTEGSLTIAILASAALPTVFPPVTIDGRKFVDGGVVDNVPIARAVELGCREIYVLHVGLHGRPEAEIRRPLDAALQAYWIARNTRFARDLGSIPAGVEAIVLPPGQRPDLRFDDFSQTHELVEQAYERSTEFLDDRSLDNARRDGGGRDGAERDNGERRRAAEILRPVQRLVLSARQGSWLQAVRRAADDPGGAIIAASDDRADGSTEDADGITIRRRPQSVTATTNPPEDDATG